MNFTIKSIHQLIKIGLAALFLVGSVSSVQADFSASDCAGFVPVGYWKLEEDGIILGINQDFDDEAPGDHWGACNDNGEHKCPTKTIGQIGYGQNFSETGDTGIDIQPFTNIDWGAASDFSIELWMKGAPASGTDVLLGRTTKQTDPGGAGMEWFLGVHSGTRTMTFWLESSASTEASSDSVQLNGVTDVLDDRWHHIAVVRNGSSGSLQLWVDGQIEITKTAFFNGDFSDDNQILTIGYLNKESYFHFNGIIDEVAVYATDLSESRIKQHFYDGDIGLRRGYCVGDTTTRIMPLGDSITQGSSGDSTPTGQQVGYRQKLDLDLYDLGRDGDTDYLIDMVGSLAAGTDFAFDWDHEGHSGALADQIGNNVSDYLTDNPADVILLHIGTNDIAAGQTADDISDEVNSILNAVYTASPKVVVLLAEIIGRTDSSTWNDETIALNNLLIDLVDGRNSTNPDEQLILVDQYGALSYPDDIEGDGIHPTAIGYQKMATVWYDALVPFLPPLNEPLPPANGDDDDDDDDGGGGGGGGGGCFITSLR